MGDTKKLAADRQSINLVQKGELGYQKVMAAVKASGEVIDARYKQRRGAIQELILTEQSYVDELKAISDVYITQLKARNIIQPKELYGIFSNVQLLVNVNSELLKDLLRLNDVPVENQMVGEIFLRLADYLKMYNQYCGNQSKAQGLVDDLKKNKVFLNFLDEAMLDQRCNGQPLQSLLIKPIQRVCRYPLLLKAILKATPEDHQDYRKLSDATDKVNEVVQEVNESKRRGENIQKISEIQNMMDGAEPGFKLVEPSRKFVREGTLTKLPSNKIYHCFLFNDMLLLGRMISGRYHFSAAINLDQAEFQEASDHSILKIVMKNDDKTYTLRAETPEIKQSWLNDVQEGHKLLEKRRAEKEKSKTTTDPQDLINQKDKEINSVLTSIQAIRENEMKFKTAAGNFLSMDVAVQRSKLSYEEQIKSVLMEIEMLRSIMDEENRKQAEIAKRNNENKAKKKHLDERQQLQRDKKKLLELRDDAQELSAITLTSSSNVNLWKKPLPTDFYEAFGLISKLALHLDAPYEVPEIVLIGPKSAGKSSLVEALIGYPINAPGTHTGRCIYFCVTHNPKYEDPHITIKSCDGQESQENFSVTELTKRLAKPSDSPIKVVFEYKYCWDFVIIDTPPLSDDCMDLRKDKDSDALIRREVSHPRRMIVCVQQSREDTTVLSNFVAQADPQGERTFFVFTKLHLQLSVSSSENDVDEAIYHVAKDVPTFFVSLFSYLTRTRSNDPATFQQRILQSETRDTSALKDTQYDKSYDKFIGISNLVNYLLSETWRKYYPLLAEVTDRLVKKRFQAQQQLNQITTQIAEAEKELQGAVKHKKLRTVSLTYLHEFVRAFLEAIEGKRLLKHYDEMSEVKSLVMINQVTSDDWEVNLKSRMMTGGAKLQELSSQFKQHADHLVIDINDIKASSVFMRKTSDVISRSVSLAQIKFRTQFEPLVEQLIIRSECVVRMIAEFIEIELRSENQQISLTKSRKFTLFVRDTFLDTVAKVAQRAREKCLEPLKLDQLITFPSKTQLSGVVQYSTFDPPPTAGVDGVSRSFSQRNESSREMKDEQVKGLADELFKSIRNHLTKNILLKFHEYFFLPLFHSEPQLISTLQAQLLSLHEESFEQLFDASSYMEDLKWKKADLTDIISNYSKSLDGIQSASSTFHDGQTLVDHFFKRKKPDPKTAAH